MRKFLKKIIPSSIFEWLKRVKYRPALNRLTRYYNSRSLKYSTEFRNDLTSSLAVLMIKTHVLQKGITMPNRRLGFGTERVRDIISSCSQIISNYGANSVEIQSALADLSQYLDIHKSNHYDLPKDIESGINALREFLIIHDDNCYLTTKEEYFKSTTNFYQFAHSRHSIRWYSSEKVNDDILIKAIKLAQTAPSACNRQATRVKIISSPEAIKVCCNVQNGNRGFGDIADKWLIITTEMGDWSYLYPYAGYIDAGIFVMNLLYSLHYYGIVACPLNAHLSPSQNEMLKKTLGIPKTESLVAFITIGQPCNSFMVPKSRRLDVNDIIQTI